MTNLRMGDVIHGFEVKRVRRIDRIEATMCEFEHIGTGTELIWMDSGEENKLFSIAFKTVPEDSTGVFHILEHSVLCGSEKYPVREPFVELLKGSMNTFLNAMTYPDKTVYPVSSRNRTDFMNLTRVYLDAVFRPAILTNPNIFYQEGWHIELSDPDAEPVFKGVVFNEMKGALSSLDTTVDYGMVRMLYPDTCYGCESGGDPADIPSLTYEKFIETYRRFYHPSNARIYLDGSVPLDEVLELIDSEYLSGVERSAEKHDIAIQKPVPAAERIQYYEIAEDEDETERANISFGRLAGSFDDPVYSLAAGILGDYLTGTNEAPLKRAILEAGLAQDVSINMCDGIKQPYLIISFENTDDDKLENIRRVMRNVIAGELEKGLDRESLEGYINRTEFVLNDQNEPQGLIRGLLALNSWLYGGDPLTYLVYDDMFARLREMLDTDEYDKLLASMFDENGLVTLRTLPSKTIGAERRAEETKRLTEIKAAWTPQELDDVLRLNRELAEWQNTPDSDEALAALPRLELSEVNPLPEKTPCEISQECGVTVMRHRIPCKGNAHLTLYFRLTDRPLENFPALSLMSQLLGELPTKRHSARELQKLVRANIGRLTFALHVMSREDDPSHCTPYLVVECSMLEAKADTVKELVTEILTETDFRQEDRIREVLLQTDELLRQGIINEAHAVAKSRVLSHYYAEFAVKDAMAGIYAYQRIHRMTKEKSAISDLIELYESVQRESVCSSRLTVGITETGDAVSAEKFIKALPFGTPAPDSAAYSIDAPMKEGVRIPAQISYAGLGYDIARCGAKYNGAGRILSNILSYGYLWNKIRVQGGAYGAGVIIDRYGRISAYSYRDPSPAATIATYRGMGNSIREFCESDEPLDKYIISTISDTEPLISPRRRGSSEDERVMRGLSYEDACRSRTEMLTATKEKLLEWAPVFETAAKDGALCVIGFGEALDACEKEGLTIIKL